MGASLKWDESLAMGFGEIDEQHQGLLERARGLLEGVAAGPPWVALGKALLELEAQTRAHVAKEEWLMRWLEYPRLPEHEEQHRAFLLQFDRLHAALDLAEPSRKTLHALTADLAAELVEHVEEADRLVGAFAFEHVLSG